MLDRNESPRLEDDSNDDASTSSSVVYDHEPFVTYSARVQAFATQTLWPGATPDEITVERLRGGGFNRVIGITRSPLDGDTTDQAQYILRIPRFDAARVDYEVAALLFLRTHTVIPAPTVINFDDTPQNALGSPYALQDRIPGVDLYASFPGLDHPSRCQLARELGTVFNHMLAVHSDTAGTLVLPPGQRSIHAPVHVLPLDSTDASLVRPYSDSPPSKSTHDLLASIFRARRATELERDSSGSVKLQLWDGFLRMTSELASGGWLSGCQNSIAHLDLAPRNILINPHRGQSDPPQISIISGILDWDSAVLAPWFMSCAPPMWLWAWQDDEDEDERAANEEPATAEAREIKALFEKAAGRDYVKLAYDPAYRLARRLVLFAIHGIRSNEDFDQAEAMLEEWADGWRRH